MSEPKSCISCGACDRKCQMGINVSEDLKKGSIEDPDCIMCGECTGACKKGVLRFGTRKI
ncbi:4Fe-4S dicluster domain-containing protein [Youngiibacter multivorans]|uniref:NAD-dependent dihydropyrimidine dehydrogenase PreA subunit n=1 Tax=Youngiibacter multivorans TaxID=937251 RepID=A0ABS4G489_9CLOT|nr:4Fe-4S dicluster domain-containing protein [Youngiibacter multivorans]MBP1919368.1 NAD-dependent dihydropyrimidine dehydrogenase PreA subunit [Youngiibacter multivorans]